MYELYENLFDNFFNEGMTRNYLKTDIIENDNGYTLLVDIPGAKKEDIKINYADRYLKINYEASKDNESQNKKYLKRERYLNSISRSYLFNDIDSNSIKASFVDGVLRIDLDKKIENTVKSIEIL